MKTQDFFFFLEQGQKTLYNLIYPIRFLELELEKWTTLESRITAQLTMDVVWKSGSDESVKNTLNEENKLSILACLRHQNLFNEESQ